MKAMMDRPHVIRMDDRVADESTLEPARRSPHERVTAHLNPLLPTLCVVLAVLWFFLGRH